MMKTVSFKSFLLLTGSFCWFFSLPILAGESNQLLGEDLGVMGEVWPIEEVSLKRAIADQAESVNWSRVGDSLKDQAEHLGQHLSSTLLPRALFNQTRYVDPSIVLDHDLHISDTLVYRQGTRVNPLAVMRPQSDLLFFDGRDSDQRAFAYEALKSHPELMLVMTQGDPIHWAHAWGHPVYFAYPKLLARFAIERVPSLLGVGEGFQSDQLAITEFQSPYQAELVTQCWHGCVFSIEEEKRKNDG